MNRKPTLNEVPGCHDGRGLVGATLGGEAAPGSRLKASFKAWHRAVPLALVLAAVALVLVMGWHRTLTLENVVALRDRFHGMLAEHCVAAAAAYIAAYALLAALSLPGCPIVTAMGGLMFGSLIGGAAAVVGATIGATLLFLIARSAIGGMLPYFALAPPKGGFKRSTRRQFREGGTLGPNPELPTVVKRMI